MSYTILEISQEQFSPDERAFLNLLLQKDPRCRIRLDLLAKAARGWLQILPFWWLSLLTVLGKCMQEKWMACLRVWRGLPKTMRLRQLNSRS